MKGLKIFLGRKKLTKLIDCKKNVDISLIFVIFTYNQLNINTMKNLLLLLALTITLLSSAQVKEMEGSWVSETSSYVMTILTNDSKPVKVFNTSFSENRFIEEVITSSDDESFTTELYNKENEYRVNIKYVLKDSNTILCYYTGDLNKTITVKKLAHFYVE